MRTNKLKSSDPSLESSDGSISSEEIEVIQTKSSCPKSPSSLSPMCRQMRNDHRRFLEHLRAKTERNDDGDTIAKKDKTTSEDDKNQTGE